MNETRKNKKGKERALKIGVSVLLLLVVGVCAYLIKAYNDVGNTASSIYNEVSVEKKREDEVDIEEATQPISFLLLGVDTGTAEEERVEQGRSDTVMVCTVNPNTRTTTLLSIPRDTYSNIVGYEDQYDYVGSYYDKINHAYAYGGVEMSINSVQNFLDIPIDYYVEVNFDGLVDVVDAIGGIEITSPLTFDFYGPQFIEGETRVFTGYEALQFSRMRKQDPEGDLGRQKRQQMVIKAILDKVLSMGSLVNYKDLLKSVEDNVQTNVTLDDVISIASGYRNALKNFEQNYLSGTEMYIDEIYYYYVDPEERLRISNLLRSELELPEITFDELETSSDEPYFNPDVYPSSSDTQSTDDEGAEVYEDSTYDYQDPYYDTQTPSYSDETYTEEIYSEENTVDDYSYDAESDYSESYIDSSY
jgi:LCP family protein required for cell wall assembly